MRHPAFKVKCPALVRRVGRQRRPRSLADGRADDLGPRADSKAGKDGFRGWGDSLRMLLEPLGVDDQFVSNGVLAAQGDRPRNRQAGEAELKLFVGWEL